MYKSSKTPFNTGSSGNPDSRSPIFHYNCLNPVSVRELPLPTPQLLSEQESGLEEGRRVYMWIYLQCGARSRVVHDRVRGYTYSFHPAGVVHLYPLTPDPAKSDLAITEALVNETSGYDTILLPFWDASSRARSPGAVKQS